LVLTGHSFGGAVAALGGTALRNAGYDLEIVRTLTLTLTLTLSRLCDRERH
jgi:thioesterase domain-containing protein